MERRWKNDTVFDSLIFFDDILNVATLKTCSQKVYQHRLGNSVMWELHGMFGLME